MTLSFHNQIGSEPFIKLRAVVFNWDCHLSFHPEAPFLQFSCQGDLVDHFQ